MNMRTDVSEEPVYDPDDEDELRLLVTNLIARSKRMQHARQNQCGHMK